MKRLSGWDAMLLYSETPNVHMHTIKVGVIDASAFDGEPTIEAFRDILRARMHNLEPMRFQLVEIPFGFHHPMWRERVDVDMEYHVRPLTLAAPGGRRALDEAIGEVASTQLDRRRPLWVMYFVDGLADGHIAVINKMHHALADGVASGNLIARAMDLQKVPDEAQDVEIDPKPSRPELVTNALQDHFRQIGRLPATIRYTVRGISRVQGSAHKVSALLRGPFTPPNTFMNHALGPERRFASAVLALADVKAVSKKLGVTINDVLLSISAGAVRRLLLEYDGHADHPLLVSVPMAIDSDPGRVWGNKFTTVAIPVPTHIADPIERVNRVRTAALSAKETQKLVGLELLPRWAAYFPPGPLQAFSHRQAMSEKPKSMPNFAVSNVAGPRERGAVVGAVVREFYSVGPLITGSGMNITVWSYADQLSISVLTDGVTTDDPHEVTDALIEAFGELRSAVAHTDNLRDC
ncbi:wax ester/triacylglycerol synthase family O-acyltransferase [Mycolicibacterium sp. 3033]|nr:wax ester/triacylglycerol synthase family O-acyltransferase [Mycolicibacterium aurantiacum]